MQQPAEIYPLDHGSLHEADPLATNMPFFKRGAFKIASLSARRSHSGLIN